MQTYGEIFTECKYIPLSDILHVFPSVNGITNDELLSADSSKILKEELMNRQFTHLLFYCLSWNIDAFRGEPIVFVIKHVEIWTIRIENTLRRAFKIL